MSIMVDRDQNRHSSHDAHRDAPGGANEADPLAELARLIGQADPFANFGRANPSHPTRRTQPVEPPPQPYSERVREQAPDVPSTGPSWMKHRTLQNRPPLPTPSPVEPAIDDTDINATPHPLHRYAAQQAAAEHETRHLPDHDSPSFAADPYPDEPAAYDPYARSPEPHDHHDRYDDQLYGAVQPTPEELYAQQQGHANTGYADDAYGYPDQYADPEPRKPRRKGLVTVAAVMALAVVGTGGAYAYRNYVGASRSGEPPVIKADTNPIKVVPPTNATDTAANSKLIQDRLATGGGERLVSREETPVDPRDPSKAGPRVVFPPLNANGNPPSTASVSPAGRTMAAPQTAPGDEPRKIKTFTVKGDQTDANGVPVGKPASRPAAPATAAKPSATNASANAPMSLSPQSSPDQRSRVASTTPTQTAPAAASGAYAVQIASQPSESEAQASLKALQGKYSSVLGSRSAQVKRHSVGQKVVYRVLVGSFGSSDEASQLCGSLKSAGGQCFVQRN